jgi:hypothetical protein
MFMRRLFTGFVSVALLIMAVLSSCQKDENVSAAKDTSVQLLTDSSQKINAAPIPGNYLAIQGTLEVKLKDSTYVFDATRDSIVFVNLELDGKEYYGITAINKEHTVSFGISSPGAPIAEMAGDISGCQFLLHPNEKTSTEYTLTQNAKPQDYGALLMDKYNQDGLLAKGSFHTYLATDKKTGSDFSVVDGSFELKVK